ncbi:MAG: hypothetical protein M0D57_00050 [Sphingobacteriales bacterium JAD_PAG50586_3]|nr:MAG: hypothetical protein M0D57_00050 [Sphingobacteriales bacterium JAD_PAG50586_3]
MKQLYALFCLFYVSIVAAQAQPAPPQLQTPCVVMEKLILDFPNNFKGYVGDDIEVDMFSQQDARFQSKISLPGARETFFYNEVYDRTNVFYTKFFEGGDSSLANAEFKKWRSKIEGCTTLPFTLGAIETEDDFEKKILWYPFDISGELEKKYGNLQLEFKVFKWKKMKPTGQFEPVYTLELRIVRSQ